MPSILLRNSVDAWVSPARTSMFGDTRLYIHSTANAYIYFAKPRLPVGSIIASATLNLYPGTTAGGASQTLSVHRLTSAFDPNGITWLAQPTVGALSGSSTRTWYNSGAKFSINVTADIQNIIDGGSWFGWRLSSNSADTSQWIGSGQSLTPMELVIQYTSPPSAPTDLYPNTNMKVTDPKPTLLWRSSGGAQGEQLAFQIQVAADSGFTTSLYTSNEISSSASSYDLDVASPAFTALTNGQTRWWRVRVKNNTNTWSAYSSAAQFNYGTAATLTITAPSGSVTADPTPTVTWTFSTTQQAYQVLVYNLDADLAETGLLYDSGIQYGTALSMNLPVGVITWVSQLVKIVVRSWASGTQVSIAGMPSYVQAEKNISWTPSGATPPVQLLITAEIDPFPPRLIRWQYTGADAARFWITRKRNGEVDKSWQILSTDAREGATQWYRTIDKVPPGRADVTYSVKTIMANGTSSNFDPEVTVKMDHLVAWVQSVYDSNRAFCLVNYNIDPGLTEISDVVRPVGAQPFLAMQHLGLYDGTASGEISWEAMPAIWHLTGEAMKADFMWLRENPRVYLTWADESIEVFIYGTNIAPFATANGKTDYRVTFNFVQIQDDIFGV